MRRFLSSMMVGMFLLGTGLAIAATDTVPTTPPVTGTKVKKSYKVKKMALKKKPGAQSAAIPPMPAPKKP